jgi:hypothetical protein
MEDGLARGYSHAVMYAALPEVGTNIALAYYHRVLHKLRQEKREGKKAPTMPSMPSAQVLSPQQPVQALDASQTKAVELLNAIVQGAPGQIATINKGSGEAPLFKYRGAALLDRDFSQF